MLFESHAACCLLIANSLCNSEDIESHINQYVYTVNDKSLEWLKFGKFGEFTYFAKLCSSKASCLIFAHILDKFTKLYAVKLIAITVVSPNFNHAKLLSSTVMHKMLV